MNDLILFQKEEIQSYTAIQPRDMEEQKALYNAMNNPTFRVNDRINMPLNLKNFYLERVDMKDRDDTTQIVKGIRVLLIDDENNSYQCVSIGIMQALLRLEAVFGPADSWPEPIPVIIRQVSLGKNSLLTLELV